MGGAGSGAAGAVEETEPLCPYRLATEGLPVQQLVEATGAEGFEATISAGALPPGVEVTRTARGLEFIGVPTGAGAFDFVVALVRTAAPGPPVEARCLVDVVPRPTVNRLAGVDRYEGSARVAHALSPGPTPLVYIASGEGFADALSATAVAAARRAPLLLATSTSVPASVLAELDTQRPSTIVLVGGENTLHTTVAAQLAALPWHPDVRRIGGSDRFAVSRALLSDSTVGLPPSTSPRLYLASGTVFADALSASVPAATQGTGVLLVDGAASRTDPDDLRVLDALGTTELWLVGGPASIGDALQDDLSHRFAIVKRTGGVDRYAVSRRITLQTFPRTTPKPEVFLAAGAMFPDALTGGVLAGSHRSPLLLVNDCIDRDVALYLGALAPAEVTLLGGPLTLPESLDELTVCRS